ncbi:MAG: sigma-70 family RNA polymerase sigma factor [bacterium]|nr:sigma-70 family RNA polymerase sigma factor [bacterium]
MTDPRPEITQLLRSGAAGRDALLERIYDELRGIAVARMRSERGHHTLQATALLHEAWMRLVGDTRMSWQDRGHFYSAASEAMRRVLVDHARRAGRVKRGGSARRVTLGAAEAELELEPERMLALDFALEQLGAEDERAAAVASLRFLTGLSVEDTAKALNASVRTIHRDWNYARARLAQLIDGT